MLPRVSWKFKGNSLLPVLHSVVTIYSRFAGLFLMFHYCYEILMCPGILAFLFCFSWLLIPGNSRKILRWIMWSGLVSGLLYAWPTVFRMEPNVCVIKLYPWWGCFPGDASSKESACGAGDPGSIRGSGRSPGGRHGNPLQYSCLENPWTR